MYVLPVFCFKVAPWAIYFQVLDHVSIVRYGLHHVEWARSNQILAGFSRKLCATTALACLAGRTAL